MLSAPHAAIPRELTYAIGSGAECHGSQRAVYVGQGRCRESAVAVGTFVDQLCRQFVHAAGKVTSGGIIAHMDARRADGAYRNVDPGSSM